MKTLTTSSSAPIDATPLSVAHSYMIVPFGEEDVIQERDEEMEKNRSADSTPIYEEIEVDQIPQASTPAPHNLEMTAEEKEEDVDIRCNTPVIHDDFWEKTHPNSPMPPPIPQVHESRAAIDVRTGTEEKSSHMKSAPEQESAASADENANVEG
ncbi:hypothetical protein ZWY2020_040031 [Hordeum vulgare]|nr:hypothetical protein ZWY2020_040031 [Hordeum vulgare]